MNSQPTYSAGTRQVMADKVKPETNNSGYTGAIFCKIIMRDIHVCRCQDSCRIKSCDAKDGPRVK